MLEDGTPGGMPPPHETMSRDVSSSGASISVTARVTSASVPPARTSRGGMLPSSVTAAPVQLLHLAERVLDAEVEEVDAGLPGR